MGSVRSTSPAEPAAADSGFGVAVTARMSPRQRSGRALGGSARPGAVGASWSRFGFRLGLSQVARWSLEASSAEHADGAVRPPIQYWPWHDQTSDAHAAPGTARSEPEPAKPEFVPSGDPKLDALRRMLAAPASNPTTPAHRAAPPAASGRPPTPSPAPAPRVHRGLPRTLARTMSTEAPIQMPGAVVHRMRPETIDPAAVSAAERRPGVTAGVPTAGRSAARDVSRSREPERPAPRSEPREISSLRRLLESKGLIAPSPEREVDEPAATRAANPFVHSAVDTSRHDAWRHRTSLGTEQARTNRFAPRPERAAGLLPARDEPAGRDAEPPSLSPHRAERHARRDAGSGTRPPVTSLRDRAAVRGVSPTPEQTSAQAETRAQGTAPFAPATDHAARPVPDGASRPRATDAAARDERTAGPQAARRPVTSEPVIPPRTLPDSRTMAQPGTPSAMERADDVRAAARMAANDPERVDVRRNADAGGVPSGSDRDARPANVSPSAPIAQQARDADADAQVDASVGPAAGTRADAAAPTPRPVASPVEGSAEPGDAARSEALGGEAVESHDVPAAPRDTAPAEPDCTTAGGHRGATPADASPATAVEAPGATPVARAAVAPPSVPSTAKGRTQSPTAEVTYDGPALPAASRPAPDAPHLARAYRPGESAPASPTWARSGEQPSAPAELRTSTRHRPTPTPAPASTLATSPAPAHDPAPPAAIARRRSPAPTDDPTERTGSGRRPTPVDDRGAPTAHVADRPPVVHPPSTGPAAVRPTRLDPSAGDDAHSIRHEAPAPPALSFDIAARITRTSDRAVDAPEQRFARVIARQPIGAPRPLPSAWQPLAAAIVGDRRVRISTDDTSRRALDAAGKIAATTGDVIHLRRSPSTRDDAAVLAHELTHVAHPSPMPRFFDDHRPSAEERQAEAIADIIRRAPVLPHAAVAATPAGRSTPRGAVPAGRSTSSSGGSSGRAVSTVRRSSAHRTTSTLTATSRAITSNDEPSTLDPSAPATSHASDGSVSAADLAALITGQATSSTAASVRRAMSTSAVHTASDSQPRIQRLQTIGEMSTTSPAAAGAQGQNPWELLTSTDETSGVLDFVDWIVERIEDRLLAEIERRGGRYRGDY